jgi:hypothetical protein
LRRRRCGARFCGKPVYDGPRQAQRETIRGAITVPGLAEVTRFFQVIPGGNAPLIFADSDGTIDVQLVDPLGVPMRTYRAREGLRWCRTHGGRERDARHTGILSPPAIPPWVFLEYQPFYACAVEPDFLLGRRGVLGWNGDSRDLGLGLISREQATPGPTKFLRGGWGVRMPWLCTQSTAFQRLWTGSSATPQRSSMKKARTIGLGLARSS